MNREARPEVQPLNHIVAQGFFILNTKMEIVGRESRSERERRGGLKLVMSGLKSFNLVVREARHSEKRI